MPRATTLLETRLETPRLVLRPAKESDIDRIVAEINDFEVTRMLARVPYPYGRADAEGFLASVRANMDKDLSLAIARDGVVIGGIGLSGIRSEREFGYWLGRAHWGVGYATEAARAFLAHVFDDLGVETVRSGVFHDNPGSLNVQKKLGFVEIGRRRMRCLARNADVEHIDTLLVADQFVGR